MEYNEQESSFISRKSSFFDTENRANEPSTHETIFSEPQPRSKLLWSSSIASPDGNVFNTSDGTTGNKEASLVSRSSGLPALQISPVPKTRTLPARNTPSKPSAYRSIHQSPSSPYKSQQHPKRLVSISQQICHWCITLTKVGLAFQIPKPSLKHGTHFTSGVGIHKTSPYKHDTVS